MLLLLLLLFLVGVVKVAAGELSLERPVEEVHQFGVLVLFWLSGGPRGGVGVVECSLDQVRCGSRSLKICKI